VKTFLFICAASLATISNLAVAQTEGPFGFIIGTSIDAYDCEDSGSSGLYNCRANNPHPAFEAYGVKASPSHGICWIKAVGIDISDSGRGSSTKSKTDEIAAQIASAYGDWTGTYDFLSVGSIWDESDEWLMGIVQKDRYYAFTWGVDDGFQPQKNITSIYVASGATRSNTGYVGAEFGGFNKAECEAEIAAEQSSVF
jgi:hypothetical protein